MPMKFLLLLFSLVVAFLVDAQEPKSIRSKFSLPVKGIVGASFAAGGYAGKILYDGPEFKENVDLTGKTILITGANTGLGKEAALR